MKEKEELVKLIAVLEKETAQLREQVGRMERELSHEKGRCEQLQAEQKVCYTIIDNQVLRKVEIKVFIFIFCCMVFCVYGTCMSLCTMCMPGALGSQNWGSSPLGARNR